MQGGEWVQTLASRLPIQGRLLAALLSAVEGDGTWEWLEISCSIARGEGDAESDLDVGLGFVGPDEPDPETVTRTVMSLGAVVDLSLQPWDQWHRWWVQYRDGGQLDLVVMPGDIRPGRAPNSVALLDRADRLTRSFTPSVWASSLEQHQGWLLDAWEALSNIAKYLKRGSCYEAFDQLSRARTDLFRLWAAGEGVPYPTFGITSLLDEPDARLPPGIESTYAALDAVALLSASLAVARILPLAATRVEPGLDTPLREYVTAKLEALR